MQTFEIKEGSPAGTVVGTIGNDQSGSIVIGERGSEPPQPPYLIVPEEGFDEVGGGDDLIINEQTGEIRSKKLLDRELTSAYVLNAIPLNGDNIKVVINVTDINDNTPSFMESRKDGSMDMDIPENIPPGTVRRLPPALDKDLGSFTTQQYKITGGNTDNAFDVKFRRQPITGILELDLIVNGNLDRERISMYTLQIVAIDGGTPPRTGSLTLRVHVQDLNDSPPLFSKQRYFTTTSEDMPLGGSVLKVSATDADAKLTPNSRITYSINRKQSDSNRTFTIEPSTGLITLSRKLDFEQARVHEIVVVARDGGEVPQETSAFVTVRVSEGDGQGFYESTLLNANNNVFDYNERTSDVKYHEKTKYFSNQAQDLSLKYLLGNNGGGVPEDILTNSEFAQLIFPQDWSKVNNIRVNLDEESKKIFSLRGDSSESMFLSIKTPIDFEKIQQYQVRIKANDPSYTHDPLQKLFTIPVIDINDNGPIFNQTTYTTDIMESVDIGYVVAKVHATDVDQGRNGQISYSLRYQDEKSSMFSDWFEIDPRSGVISTASSLDCELESSPQVIVVASDNGTPNFKTSTSTLSVTIKDVNDNVPLFEQSFYEANLSEDEAIGKCFLTIKANDQDCGANGTILYSLEKADTGIFEIDSSSGKLCLKDNSQGDALDREQRESFSFIAVAKDQGGLSASALIAINVIDVNDNSPIFLPTEYSAKISWNSQTNNWANYIESPILSVRATDADENGPNSDITYHIADGNDEQLFSLDEKSGALHLDKRSPSQQLSSLPKWYSLVVQARDGAGRTSESHARIDIQIVSMEEATNFSTLKFQYEFNVKEDVSPYSEIGSIPLPSPDYSTTITQSSYSGFFSIDPRTGIIRTEARLDFETHPEVILNIRIQTARGDERFDSQLVIHLEDVNDNAPEFPSRVAIASIPEDFPARKVIYMCKATDADSGPDGRITYNLKQNSNDLFYVDRQSGAVWLTNGGLDFEVSKEHYLVIEAEDHGRPKLKATMKLIVHIHDVNDNSPMFDKPSYTVAMSESVTVGSSIATIRASDKDDGRNGRITYSLRSSDDSRIHQSYIKVFPNSGTLVLNRPLDRNVRESIELYVIAKDHGNPPLQAETRVVVLVADRNDQSPVFHNPDGYKFKIQENLPPGLQVGNILATDDDFGPNGEVEYRLRTPGVTSFLVENDSGKIVTLKSLDRESDGDEHEFVVEALDRGQPRRSTQTVVKILVEDVNDESPKLVQPANRMLYVNVNNAGIGTVIGRIVAEDQDLNDRVTYQLSSNNEMFQLDKWTGDLRLTRALPTGTTNTTITIQMLDSSNPPNYTSEKISIVSFSDNDQLQNLIPSNNIDIYVNQDTRVGSVLGSIESDAIPKQDSLYKEVKESANDNGKEDAFYLDMLSGDIYSLVDLNTLTQSTYEMKVIVQIRI